MSRGILYSLSARILFILGAYIIHIYAGRKLGIGLYGAFGVVLSILTISCIFLNNGVRQAVSKAIALRPSSAKKLFHNGLITQFIFAAIICLIVSGFASELARFFKDGNLLTPLRICGVVILVQGIFFVHTGALNGLKRFLAENVLVCIYSIIRPAAVLLLISFGFGVSGAVCGFLIASILAIAVGVAMMSGAENQPFDLKIKDILQPAIANIVIFGSGAVLMNVDLLFVKRFMAGMDSAGLYTAAAAFSKPPYWFLYAFGSVALPLVAISFGKGDSPQCKIYLSQVLRYSTIIFLPVVVIIAATSEELIVFFYKPEYGPAGLPLRILIFGIWFVGLVSIMAHLMIAIGKERLMAVISLIAIALDVILNITLIPRFGLNGAALATTLSAFALLLASGCYLIKNIGFDIVPMTIFRLVILLAIVYFLANAPPFDNMPLLVEYIILYVGFALGLIVTREIGPEDWAVIKRLIQSGNEA